MNEAEAKSMGAEVVGLGLPRAGGQWPGAMLLLSNMTNVPDFRDEWNVLALIPRVRSLPRYTHRIVTVNFLSGGSVRIDILTYLGSKIEDFFPGDTLAEACIEVFRADRDRKK